MPNDLNLWEALFASSDELFSTCPYSLLRNIIYYSTVEALMKVTDFALVGCKNKRVVHLARHGKKKIQKKNLNRAMKIIAKERNHE